jgi:hypothetical protein
MMDAGYGPDGANGSGVEDSSGIVTGGGGPQGFGGGAGRKRVRDSTNGLTAVSSAGEPPSAADAMRDDADGDPYDVDMETQVALDQADRDGDIAAVASLAASWPGAQAGIAPSVGARNGVPFYPELGAADMDDEYVLLSRFPISGVLTLEDRDNAGSDTDDEHVSCLTDV